MSYKTDFKTNELRASDATDSTKKLAFDTSAFTTGTTRTLTIQNSDGTIAYISDILVQSVNSQTGAVVLNKTDMGLANVVDGLQFLDSNVDTDNTLAADSDTKVPSQKAIKFYVDGVAIGALQLQGNWDADTNTPDITGTTTTGYAFIVSVAGTTNLGGIAVWAVGDWAIKTDLGWAKIDNSVIPMAWGQIGGTLSDQTDLQAALDLKIETSVLTIDPTLAADSDLLIATQKSTKAYVDAAVQDVQTSSITFITKTADYGVQITDAGAVLEGDGTSASVDFTLPLLSGLTKNYRWEFRSINIANTIRVVADGSDVIEVAGRGNVALYDFIQQHEHIIITANLARGVYVLS